MKLIMTKGLPASGKTTWAKELLEKNPGKYKRINKDDLRSLFDNGKWSKNNEEFVLHMRDMFITMALLEGFSVIVDDTNLAPKHEKRLRELVDQHNSVLSTSLNPLKAQFEIKDFTDVPLEECIKRDQARPNYVGEKVIKRMYNQFLRPKPVRPKFIEGKPYAVICDLDGTMCLFGDANPYDRDFSQDEPNALVKRILLKYADPGTRVIFVSGRKDSFRKVTEEWLETYWGTNYALYMRAADDTRKDVVVKQEIYENHIKGNYNVEFVLDDRDQVVEFWRSQGLTCFQVAEGDF